VPALTVLMLIIIWLGKCVPVNKRLHISRVDNSPLFGVIMDRIILFYMDNLIKPGGLFYIKVHENWCLQAFVVRTWEYGKDRMRQWGVLRSSGTMPGARCVMTSGVSTRLESSVRDFAMGEYADNTEYFTAQISLTNAHHSV